MQQPGALFIYQNAGAPVDGTNEVQTITPDATPAAGTFKLKFDGYETAALDYDVSAADMQTALNALSSIGTSGVGVTLSEGVYTVTFSGTNVNKRAQNLITVEESTLVDSEDADVTLTVAESVEGVTSTAHGALKGALLIDTTNGVLYINVGTPAAVDWRPFIPSDALSAAELELLDGVVAGTVTASKALVAGANKNLDELHLAALYLGAGAGTLVALTAAELNQLDGSPMGATLVVGTEADNVINVAIQLEDGNGDDLAVRGAVKVYLAGDENGDTLAAAAPTGGCAIGTDGLLVPVTPAISNALIVDGGLAIDATPEKFKTAQTAAFMINGVSHTKAPTAELVFSAAHVITASKFGVILVQINAAGTVSTKVPGATQAYDDAPTALAALPAADAGNVALGYIAIENNAGDWTANTDDLTNGSDLTTASFTDATETAIGAAKAFEVVSESDGDIDINITDSGTPTFYMVVQLPNGKIVVSDAITFE